MILCVSLTGCYPIASYRCSCFQLPVEAQLVILKISWFVFNPKQADLHPRLPTSPTLRIAAQKQTLRPPAGWRDGPQNPHGSAHPVSGLVGNAKWMQWSGSLRATSVILSHLPAKREGERRSGGLKEGWAGLWERIPLPTGWSGWMRVTIAVVTSAKISQRGLVRSRLGRKLRLTTLLHVKTGLGCTRRMWIVETLCSQAWHSVMKSVKKIF